MLMGCSESFAKENLSFLLYYLYHPVLSKYSKFIYKGGGICADSVTQKTNYLVLGNNDYCKTIKDGKSSKQKKAERFKLSGLDIEIISENIFLT